MRKIFFICFLIIFVSSVAYAARIRNTTFGLSNSIRNRQGRIIPSYTVTISGAATDFLLLDDGVSFVLLDDGVSKILIRP